MSTTASLDAALAALRPVTLAELEGKAAMLDRLDHKYVVDLDTLQRALQQLAAHFDVLEIDGRRRFDYETRYFDDPDLNGYLDHHRARRRRAKVRVRHYTDSGALWLEVKLRSRRGSSTKKRLPCDRSTWQALGSGALQHVQRCHADEYGQPLDRQLQPVLDMRYTRCTLVARAGGERMTIDLGLHMWAGDRLRMVADSLAIVETKSACGRGLADRVLRGLHQHPVRHCSKYCLAVAALGLNPQINRFRPALSRLGLLPTRGSAAPPARWRQGLAAGALALQLAAPGWAQAPAQPTVVEVAAARDDEQAARRDSVAAALVVTREEIERMGDSHVTDLLKRLPGVVLSGKPGKDGTPKLRGLGNGYTQILVDGERAPKNFSLDLITPDQIERIEILRSATAETGTRAVAGTINIVLADGAQRRADTLRAALGGSDSGGLRASLTRRKADSDGRFGYDLLAGLDHRSDRERRLSDSQQTVLVNQRVALSQLQERQDREDRQRINLGATLRWNLGDGQRFTLSPQLLAEQTDTRRSEAFIARAGSTAADYDHATGQLQDRQWQARLLAGWRAPLGSGTRYELNAQASTRHENGSARRDSFNLFGSTVGQRSEHYDAREDKLRLSGRLLHWLDDSQQLSTGFEAENQTRDDSRSTLENGAAVSGDLGDTLQARSQRSALYAQHQWLASPTLSVQSGLRWEGITSRGAAADGSAVNNRSSVLSPLLHLSWQPGSDAADRVRLGLTHSYRPAALQDITAQPVIASDYPTSAGNSASSPDQVGNAALRPERAAGIDLGWDRKLADDGVLGLHGFVRHIQDPIRRLLSLQTVSWSPAQRWVLRPTNIGSALTWGADFDLRLRAGRYWPAASGLELRANLGLYRSRVQGVPGPDNRLDGQPPAVMNLGADYRLAGLPLRLGSSLNWSPGYTVRLSDSETVRYGARRTLDAYALWTLSRDSKLRLAASNLGPRDLVRGTTLDADGVRHEVLRSTSTSAALVLRWERDL